MVLGITFGFHEYGKRIKAASETRRAMVRSGETERLLALCQALAGALDDPALRQILARYLPSLCGDRRYWLLRRQHHEWDPLFLDAIAAHPLAADVLEHRATRTVASLAPFTGDGAVVDDDACFPLLVGDAVVGVLGIRNAPPLSTSESRTLAAAASLIALTLRNIQLIQEAHDQGVLDDLTGCITRTPGLARLDSELRRARRTRYPLAVLVFDIDEFKQINDTRGHLCGDLALEWIGARLDHILRTSDIRCRLGGDEFLVVLPETPPEGASCVAEKLRTGMAEPHPDRPDLPPITISVGAAMAAAGESDALALVNRADEALYRAKRNGRNRVCFANTALEAAVGAALAPPRHVHLSLDHMA
jgi:diguanylate cyclase (GGDEF)-like protein